LIVGELFILFHNPALLANTDARGTVVGKTTGPTGQNPGTGHTTPAPGILMYILFVINANLKLQTSKKLYNFRFFSFHCIVRYNIVKCVSGVNWTI